MNKLEIRYEAQLYMQVKAGDIYAYGFERIKFKLAKKTFYTPDFYVVGFNLEFHEVKGHWEDDARVKIKTAAEMFPWFRWVGVTWDRVARMWKYEDF